MDKTPRIFYNESSALFFFFIEQALGVQCRFDAAERLRRGAAQGVQMHTAGHPAQQALGRIRRLLDKWSTSYRLARLRLRAAHRKAGSPRPHPPRCRPGPPRYTAPPASGRRCCGHRRGCPYSPAPPGGADSPGRCIDLRPRRPQQATSPTTICRETPSSPASTLALSGASASVRRSKITFLRCAAFIFRTPPFYPTSRSRVA